jgi:hypothetical protein
MDWPPVIFIFNLTVLPDGNKSNNWQRCRMTSQKLIHDVNIVLLGEELVIDQATAPTPSSALSSFHASGSAAPHHLIRKLRRTIGPRQNPCRCRPHGGAQPKWIGQGQ